MRILFFIFATILMTTIVIEKFNIRVYGLMINEYNEVLVTDEREFGMDFTKFPGGGLEPGEGIIDTLHREWKEETGQSLYDAEHFYTTEFFQPSAFNSQHQIISIYFLVKSRQTFERPISQTPFHFKNNMTNEQIAFRWLKIEENFDKHFTFPIDKVVATKLASWVYSKNK